MAHKHLIKQKPEYFKKRSEWLGSRGIGGSDIGAIMNLSSFKSSEDVFADKVYGTPGEDDNKSDLLLRGTLAEDHIRQLFALSAFDEYEVEGQPTRRCWLYRHPKYSFITCSPDGLLKDKKTGEVGGLEIKFVDIYSGKQAEKWEGQLPPQYFAQCAWYLATMSELTFVNLVAFQKHYVNIEGQWKFDYAEMKIYTVKRDEPSTKAFIDYEIKKAIEFDKSVREKLLMPVTFSIEPATKGDSGNGK